MKDNNDERLELELRRLIKAINDKLTGKKKIVPEDEKYYKKYEGAGARTAAAWSAEPKLNAMMRQLIYEMHPEEKLWDEYGKKYFKTNRMRLEFGSEEFMKYFMDCWQVRKFMHGKYDSIEEASKASKRDIIAWWGQLISDIDERLEYGKIYNFNFRSPINENVPSYDDFVKEL